MQRGTDSLGIRGKEERNEKAERPQARRSHITLRVSLRPSSYYLKTQLFL
jgi:protocatechuate 3,4-dioxygenase beta subunit